MSYGVALRNGIPFTLGTIAALCVNATTQWNPLRLWPNGIATPGMWISPRDLTSEWKDYQGITPVVTPGTVADSSNPVGLALDIRAGATVLTDPGNHMLQSTSAARPLLSARVNWLTYTEDFSSAAWTKIRATATATRLAETATTGSHALQKSVTCQPGTYTVFADLSAGTRRYAIVSMSDFSSGDASFLFDLVSGTYSASPLDPPGSWTNISGAITPLGGGVYRCRVTGTRNAGPVTAGSVYMSNGTQFSYAGDTDMYLDVFRVQVSYGSTASDYQAILTDGSTYPSTGFPTFAKFDGVDDGMATAAFSAGTLTSGMDCMIAVRRDSAASCVAGLYNGIADATKFFGMAESASGSGCVGSGAGTPTVWVDNTQLTGGTAVTRGTLHTALTVGDWHILEFRNLDLSTWTASGFGLYTSYVFPGPRGDILLYPSTASTEDKDAARQWLADYYGVTL